MKGLTAPASFAFRPPLAFSGAGDSVRIACVHGCTSVGTETDPEEKKMSQKNMNNKCFWEPGLMQVTLAKGVWV